METSNCKGKMNYYIYEIHLIGVNRLEVETQKKYVSQNCDENLYVIANHRFYEVHQIFVNHHIFEIH